MRTANIAKYATIAVGSVTILTACSGSSAPPFPGAVGPSGRIAGQASASPSPSRSLPELADAALAGRRRQGSSWLSSEAVSDDLVYVSNAYTVTVYSYPQGKLVGTLRGFLRPLGDCADAAGSVFIANGTGQVFEYAHGGKRRIATLNYPGYSPESCTVDATTGDLAVAIDTNTEGYVAVYKHGRGTPTLYRDANMVFAFCSYDGAGNLFLDGLPPLNRKAQFEFAELPRGGRKFKNIELDQTIGWPGGVEWDGKYVAVGDQYAPVIYQFKISGSNGAVEGSTPLGGGADDVHQFWIQDSTLIATNTYWTKSETHSNILFFDYPSGGKATKTITRGVGGAVGVTISRATHS
jgi:hypothetical protein